MVADKFGLVIDAIFYADMAQFEAFIDDIGGLSLTMNEEIHDVCGDQEYHLAIGNTYTMSGHDVLCFARMRHSVNGYFDRQVRHIDILQAMWSALKVEMITDPVELAEAALAHPFVKLWPFIEAPVLARIAISASQADFIDYRVRSLDAQYLEEGKEIGPLADGSIGEFNVFYSVVDLRQWVQEAIK